MIKAFFEKVPMVVEKALFLESFGGCGLLRVGDLLNPLMWLKALGQSAGFSTFLSDHTLVWGLLGIK